MKKKFILSFIITSLCISSLIGCGKKDSWDSETSFGEIFNESTTDVISEEPTAGSEQPSEKLENESIENTVFNDIFYEVNTSTYTTINGTAFLSLCPYDAVETKTETVIESESGNMVYTEYGMEGEIYISCDSSIGEYLHDAADFAYFKVTCENSNYKNYSWYYEMMVPMYVGSYIKEDEYIQIMEKHSNEYSDECIEELMSYLDESGKASLNSIIEEIESNYVLVDFEYYDINTFEYLGNTLEDLKIFVNSKKSEVSNNFKEKCDKAKNLSSKEENITDIELNTDYFITEDDYVITNNTKQLYVVNITGYSTFHQEYEEDYSFVCAGDTINPDKNYVISIFIPDNEFIKNHTDDDDILNVSKIISNNKITDTSFKDFIYNDTDNQVTVHDENGEDYIIDSNSYYGINWVYSDGVSIK